MPILDEKMRAVVARGRVDLPFFCRTFLPETFHIEFPQDEMTREFFRILTDRSLSHVVIAAHRGFGKTSIISGLLAQLLLYRLTNYVVYCSLTDRVALQQTESLKFELESNERIRTAFGRLKSDRWAQDEWITAPLVEGGRTVHYGSKMVPSGVGQQIRGTRYLNRYRPDFIIIDDVQDRKAVRSEAMRAAAWEWFDSDVMRAVSPYSKYGPGEFPPKVVVIGNVLHDDSIVCRLLADAQLPGSIWTPFVFPICDDDLHSTRPGFISDEEVKALHDEMKRGGKITTFVQEYQCKLLGEEDKRFHSEYVQYFSEAELDLSHQPGIETIVCCDPAQSVEAQSCHSAIVVWSVDMINQKFYIREVRKEKYHPDQFYSEAIDLAIRYKARVISCGTQGLAEYITYPFENAIRLSGAVVEFIPVPETRREGAKDERIGALIPFYRQGYVMHPGVRTPLGTWNTTIPEYEAEQDTFPNSSHKDVLDAASHLVWLLDNSDRFMDLEDPDETAADVEAEFEGEDEYSGSERFDHQGWKVKI